MASDLAGSSASWSSLVFNLNLITMGPLWVTSEIWVWSTSMEALTRLWLCACDYMCMCAQKYRIARSSVRMCACRSPRGAGTSLCACGFWPKLALKIWPASEGRLLGLRQKQRANRIQVPFSKSSEVWGGHRRGLYLWKSDGINVNKQF